MSTPIKNSFAGKIPAHLSEESKPELFEHTIGQDHSTPDEVTSSKIRPMMEYDSDRSLKTKAQIKFRLASESDYKKGFPALLSQLTTLGDISEEDYYKRLRNLYTINSQGCFLFWIIVGEDIDTGRVVSCATLLIEPKFIHHCGSVAHVEDVVVDQAYRKLRIGQKMMDILIQISKEQGCYKIILDCNEENTKFYSSLGFSRNSVHMALYLDEH